MNRLLKWMNITWGIVFLYLIIRAPKTPDPLYAVGFYLPFVIILCAAYISQRAARIPEYGGIHKWALWVNLIISFITCLFIYAERSSPWTALAVAVFALPAFINTIILYRQRKVNAP
jgi:hypothetical protein